MPSGAEEKLKLTLRADNPLHQRAFAWVSSFRSRGRRRRPIDGHLLAALLQYVDVLEGRAMVVPVEFEGGNAGRRGGPRKRASPVVGAGGGHALLQPFADAIPSDHPDAAGAADDGVPPVSSGGGDASSGDAGVPPDAGGKGGAGSTGEGGSPAKDSQGVPGTDMAGGAPSGSGAEDGGPPSNIGDGRPLSTLAGLDDQF